jgi:hypothetical protein
VTRRRAAKPAVGGDLDVRVWPDGSVEVDLFGEVDAELARRAETDRVRAEFERRAHTMPDGTPVIWVAPYNAPSARRGDAVTGWRCWLCARVEGNAYALELAHGLHPSDLTSLTRATCLAQELAARHETTTSATESGDPR